MPPMKLTRTLEFVLGSDVDPIRCPVAFGCNKFRCSPKFLRFINSSQTNLFQNTNLILTSKSEIQSRLTFRAERACRQERRMKYQTGINTST